ncbi:hypothetical protein LJC20_04765 [Eubacteriales bacterium OttesenSCG-928-M02]|nr:hypothetical protein [Eubacteriales bacterium OttesenSCG-928-M02]
MAVAASPAAGFPAVAVVSPAAVAAVAAAVGRLRYLSSLYKTVKRSPAMPEIFLFLHHTILLFFPHFTIFPLNPACPMQYDNMVLSKEENSLPYEYLFLAIGAVGFLLALYQARHSAHPILAFLFSICCAGVIAYFLPSLLLKANLTTRLVTIGLFAVLGVALLLFLMYLLRVAISKRRRLPTYPVPPRPQRHRPPNGRAPTRRPDGTSTRPPAVRQSRPPGPQRRREPLEDYPQRRKRRS